MYLDGSSISAIGRVLHIKLGTVYIWVKKAQQAGELLPRLVQQERGHAAGLGSSGVFATELDITHQRVLRMPNEGNAL